MKRLLSLLLAGLLSLPLAAQQPPAIVCTPTTGGAFRCQEQARPSARRLAIVLAAIGGGALIWWAAKRKRAPAVAPRPLTRPTAAQDARLASLVPGPRPVLPKPAR